MINKYESRRFLMAVGLVLCTTTTHAQTFSFSYDSDVGDPIGQGESGFVNETDGELFVTRNPRAGVRVDFRGTDSPWWDFDFSAPGGEEITEQTYIDAQLYGFSDPDQPGLYVRRSGGICSSVAGEFTFSNIIYEWYGEPIRFSGTFEQHCNEVGPALRGTFEYDYGFRGQALSNGNLLLSLSDSLYEYSLEGQLIQEIPVLESQGSLPSGTEYLRDVVVSRDGQIHAYNGTFSPFLSSGYPENETWRHDTMDSWFTFNNATYGGITTNGRYVYVTDMDVDAQTNGVIRFDREDDFSAQRFQSGTNYIDLNLGLDNLLYALRSDEDTLDVFMPDSMELVRTISLPERVRSIAISADGEIFAVENNVFIYRFDSNGVQLDELIILEEFADIDIFEDGTLVIGANRAMVIITSSDLDSYSTFAIPGIFERVFVGLIRVDHLFSNDFE